MRSVLLVGCGNIGFRHLQAITGLETPVFVSVVEPNTDAHDRIRSHLASEHGAAHQFLLMESLPHHPTSFDLAVVATTASHRRSVVEELLGMHLVGGMLLEKVVAQTLDDLARIGTLVQSNDVRSFVNCGRRTFDGYAQIRDQIDARPAEVFVRGVEFGLASNAIHFLDLVEYLNQSEVCEVDLSGLAPGSTPSKRPGFIEIYGEMRGRCVNGAEYSVQCEPGGEAAIEVAVQAGRGSWRIDEVRRLVEYGGLSTSFASQNVSETTSIYRDLIETRACVLTPYDASVRQHALFITALRSHLGLSNERDEPCPIS